MYTILECLYSYLYIGPGTIVTETVDKNLEFIVGDIFGLKYFTLIFRVLHFYIR